MAAKFMSQNEIDNMLSSISESAEAVKNDDSEPVSVESMRTYKKLYKWKAPEIVRNSYEYVSPVIKSEQIVYDPPPRMVRESDPISVLSLAQYKTRKRRQSVG
ncbi:hypothetical protein ACFL5P_01660 [candidate division KSB1 bacterium]